MSSNPGVGLKLTEPRIQETNGPQAPSPQSYSIRTCMDVTERQKYQNELLSKRYEGKDFSLSTKEKMQVKVNQHSLT